MLGQPAQVYGQRRGAVGLPNAHWNGTTWSLAPSPVTGPGGSALNGITVLPGGTFWAVGSRQVNGTFIPLTLRLTPS